LQRSRADGVWLAASLLYRGDDSAGWRGCSGCRRASVPLLATNEVLYHHPARRPLQDVLTCIREKTTIDAIGRRLEANAERYLKPRMKWRGCFATCRSDRGNHAVCRPHRFLAGSAQIPVSRRAGAAGQDRAAHLEDLTWAGRAQSISGPDSTKTRKVLHKEAALIAKLKYAHYFLTVHDIVAIARSQNILCQGRGSAANSAVCYVLGITSVDPTKVDLLFERSFPRSGWSRPTSTSISSTRGARR
jgi:error-prone DNA polymerase